MEFGTNYTPETGKYLIKVVVIGDISVGKTNIIKRILSKEFEDTQSTIGVEFGYLTINNIDKDDPSIKLCIQIWDTSGAERYRSITTSHIRNADGAFLVYDICSETSFNDMKYWYDCIKNATDDDIVLFLLGNKSDLIKVEGREVETSTAQDFVKNYNMHGFSECSAKKNENIVSTFKLFYETIYQRQKEKLKKREQEKKEYTNIKTIEKNELSKCCDL